MTAHVSCCLQHTASCTTSQDTSECVQQLKHLSSQCTADGVRPSPVSLVFESDTALDGLGAEILAALVPLEEVPEAEKTWQPGSQTYDPGSQTWQPGSSNQVCSHCPACIAYAAVSIMLKRCLEVEPVSGAACVRDVPAAGVGSGAPIPISTCCRPLPLHHTEWLRTI